MTDPNPSQESSAQCAHLKVSYQKGETVNGRIIRGWWECASGCGAEFVMEQELLDALEFADAQWDAAVKACIAKVVEYGYDKDRENYLSDNEDDCARDIELSLHTLKRSHNEQED